jgi:PKD repeat protein/formylglycine-generating enzyme required for sulfatase activity
MKKTILFLIAFLPIVLFGKDLQFNGVSIQNIDATAQTAEIHFNIGWQFSWRNPNVNWDAAWVFFKLKRPNGQWTHLYLNDSGHSVPTTGVVELGLFDPCAPFDITSNKALGAFLYRSQAGTDSFGLSGVVLKIRFDNLPISAINPSNLQMHALEMVYIPRDSFFVGSGGSEISPFYTTPNTNAPFLIKDESPIDVNQGFGTLNYASSNNGGDRMGPIPLNFPKGFEAFYMMKYHISQQQWVNFLNSLTIVQQSERANLSVFSPAGTYVINSNRNKVKIQTPSLNGQPAVFETEFPYVPALYLDWPDLAAYLDWAGLRPFTELEFEKAGRGPIFPVPNEFAWGTAAIRGTLSTADGYQLINSGLINESVNVINPSQTGPGIVGEAIYRATAASGFSIFPFNGPGRIGIFEKEGTRQEQGKSYYGVCEMSGQLWDRAVSVGRPNGRLFRGTHGDGVLTPNGDANSSTWPSNVGMGFRGGAYGSIALHQTLSDRLSAAANYPNRASGNGGRGARSAPTQMIGAFTSLMFFADSVSMSFNFDASGSVGATSFNWSFGDGNTGSGEVVNHTYTTNDTMVVRLIVSNACYSDTLYDTLIVSGLLQPCPNILNPDFTFTTNALAVNFSDISTVLGTATYRWSFGDGATSTLRFPSHTYSLSGNYNVCLSVTDSCFTDSICKTISVCGNPPLAFTWSPMGTNLLQFNSNWPSTSTFLWDFGNGSTSTQANPVQFLLPGNYNICLTVTDSLCGTQTVCELLTPCNTFPLSFTTTPTAPLTVRFVPSTMGANSYLWDLGDGRSSIVPTPLVTYGQEGRYQVCLTIQDSCGTSSVCDSVEISSTVSTNDFSTANFNVYPNPAKHQLVIDNPNKKLVGYTFYNSLGQVQTEAMPSQNDRLTLQVDQWPRGLYVLQLVFDGQIVTKRVVLE